MHKPPLRALKNSHLLLRERRRERLESRYISSPLHPTIFLHLLLHNSIIRTLTKRTKGGFLEHREATIVDSEVVYVEPKEHVPLQLRQVVVPKPKVEYHDVRFSLEYGHGLEDVCHVSDLAHDVQAGLFHAAGTGRDLVGGRTEMRRLRQARRQHEAKQPHQPPHIRQTVLPHFSYGSTPRPRDFVTTVDPPVPFVRHRRTTCPPGVHRSRFLSAARLSPIYLSRRLRLPVPAACYLASALLISIVRSATVYQDTESASKRR